MYILTINLSMIARCALPNVAINCYSKSYVLITYEGEGRGAGITQCSHATKHYHAEARKNEQEKIYSGTYYKEQLRPANLSTVERLSTLHSWKMY